MAEKEPNETRISAYGVGEIDSDVSLSQKGALGDGDSEDWWAFDVSELANYTLSVAPSQGGSMGDTDLTLYRGDEQVQHTAGSLTQLDSGKTWDFQGRPGASYYVQLEGGAGDYSLALEGADRSIPASETETNDSRLEPTALGSLGPNGSISGAGNLVNGDPEDWWAFDVSELANYTLSVAPSQGGSMGDTDLTLYRGDEQVHHTAGSLTQLDSGKTWDFQGRPGGSYYVQLEGGTGDYSLALEGADRNIPLRESEMNDSRMEATGLGEFGNRASPTAKGNLVHGDGTDWWQFDVTESGDYTLSVAPTQGGTMGNTNLTLYQGDEQIKKTSGALDHLGTGKNWDFSAESGQTYYVQLDGGRGDYALSLEGSNPDEQNPEVGFDQAFDIQENAGSGAVLGDVQASDNEAGTGVARFAIASGRAEDWVAIDDSGQLTLTNEGVTSPLNDFETGSESYTVDVVAFDGAGNPSDPQAVTLHTADAPDQAPQPNADTAATPANQDVQIDVLANDADPDGDALEIKSVSTPSHGQTQVTDDNRILYQPAGDFIGDETFSYTVGDGRGYTAQGEVTVSVEAGKRDLIYTTLDSTPNELGLGGGVLAELVGDTSGHIFRIEEGAGATNVDPGSTVLIAGNSSDYTYTRDGTTLTLSGSGGDTKAVLNAAPDETTTVRFHDGSMELGVDLEAGAITFGGQTLADGVNVAGSQLAPGSDQGSGPLLAELPQGGFEERNLIGTTLNRTPEEFTLGEGAMVELVGDTSGHTVNVPDSAGVTNVDPGSTVNLESTGADLTYTRDGTTLRISDGEGHLQAILNAQPDATTALRFLDGGTELGVDLEARALTVGGQQLANGESVSGDNLSLDSEQTSSTVFPEREPQSLEALGGTLGDPASFDAGSESFQLRDTVEQASNTEVADFGPDDELLLEGINAQAVDFKESQGNVAVEFDNGSGVTSQITLLGQAGDNLEGLSAFNNDPDTGTITFA